MNQLIVNENHIFSIDSNSDVVSLDGKDFTADLIAINATTFHILQDGKSYTAEVVSLNKEEKKVLVKINGNSYSVSLRDQYDLLLDNLGMQFTSKKTASTLKAPMPGMVLDLMVQVGDSVKKGDSLLILEAMKMENIIKCAEDAVIKSIEISKQAIVEKNQVLLTFE